MGAAIGRSIPELMLYVIGGFHIATIIAAMVFVALMAFRTLGGPVLRPRQRRHRRCRHVLVRPGRRLYRDWYPIYMTK